MCQASINPAYWPTRGFGYVANVPDQPIGFNYMNIGRKLGELGLFLDFKVGLNPYDRSDDYYETISINKAENIFGDKQTGDGDRSASINGGIVLSLSPKVSIYLGSGVTLQTNYRSYRDPLEILGTKGTYWVKESDDHKINFLSGLVLSNDRYFFQVGYEAVPSGLSLGLGYLFW